MRLHFVCCIWSMWRPKLNDATEISLRDSLLFAVPLILCLVISGFKWDGIVWSTKKPQGRKRQPCGMDLNGQPILRDPDGRLSEIRISQRRSSGRPRRATLRPAEFFHNGAVHSLEGAVRFYVELETRPEKWHRCRADGTVVKYDDLPVAYRVNVDIKDAPFNHDLREPPGLSEAEIKDVVAFLNRLTGGSAGSLYRRREGFIGRRASGRGALMLQPTHLK
jgi:hypothetical protein